MKILSFDIEDWFNLLEHPSTDDITNWKNFESRVESSTIKILDLLDETNTKATFFVLGWVAENQPEIVKEMVNRSYEMSLDEGLLFERRGFHSLFATEDQKEGMAAFLEKREAQFRDK